MSTVVHVALVPRGVNVDIAEVTSVAAALSIQVARDFRPIWGISATVSAFTDPSQVPVGFWPIYIEDPSNLPQGAGGVHLDNSNQPYSLIETGDHWSLDASHECLEMLVDPTGNKTQAAELLAQAVLPGHTASQVEYVVEVCDPVEDAQYAYQINGVLVSDFFTPSFYDPVATPGTRYDFTGALTKPLQVLTNGYISYLDPASGNTYQYRNFIGPNGQLDPEILNLSANAQFNDVLAKEALRPAIDRVTCPPDFRASLTDSQRMSLSSRRDEVQKAAKFRSDRHNVEILAALGKS